MGTNTFHLVIALIKGGSFDLIHRERRAVRIGEKGINEGFITDEASARAIATMIEFRKIIDEHAITHIQATATSAFRNAKNGHALATGIYEAVGIRPRIISGLEEAELIFEGVNAALDIGEDPALVMDIGGGSIEFIIGNRYQVFWKESFEIGGQRLLEKYHRNDPMTQEDQGLLDAFLDVSLQDLIQNAALHKPRVLIGTSGTFDTLSDIYIAAEQLEKKASATERPLSIEGFHTIHQQLTSKNRAARLAIPGMIEMRVDMIVVASILVSFVLNRLGLEDIRVSAYALKEGLLHQTINVSRSS